ncbi:MAG: deoxyribodipyrimidine photolyase, partial [Candidatus Marinimicrobia bacterium]|nr:deoxyribodipyrimidine photolyase [Candidatus Neomarinimicrobiota bacterium]
KNSESLNSLNLLPKFKWYKKLETHWDIGEKGAKKSFKNFINNGLSNYKKGRNFPSEKNVSRLSPHIHFGEISINRIWSEIEKQKPTNNTDHFKSELGWREFSYNLLYFNKDLSRKNYQEKFDFFPWEYDEKKFYAWKKGLTGYPIVDAGMRELWQTGYIHNRVRMIVGSFLVKNLLIDWRYGERWFWNCLVDADLANNSASWQWVAGSGADAAPYFRIFNPVIQGFKFDENGKYTKKFIPELKNIPNKFLFNPWECPKEILEKVGIKLGDNYPKPIVDLKNSRNDALLAYQKIKK